MISEDAESYEENPKVSFIPCLTWVKRGVAKAKLEKAKHSKEELKELMKSTKLRETATYPVTNPLAKKEKPDGEAGEGRNVDDIYDLDNYDTDEEGRVLTGTPTTNFSMMLNNAQGDSSAEDSLDSDEEPEEFTVKEGDNLIVCGHVQGDACILETYVFNNDKAELFILNEVFLPSYPICVEWLDFNPKHPSANGHYAAVGCTTPEIGVWNLNLTGNLEPAFKLGSMQRKTMRHSDAVLDLSWHKDNRNVLASGSADHTVLLWDMRTTYSVTRLDSFEEKVQSVKWHPFETQTLLTGCCDGKVRLFDCRSPAFFKTWGFEGEIERVMWNAFDPFYFFATTDKGMVYYLDTRQTAPIWTLKGHDKEVTGICQSSQCRDMLVTGSMDKSVKVWDLQGGTPAFVSEKNMAIGELFTLASCPNVPYVFCAGGSNKDNHLYVWDSRESDVVMERFQGRQYEDATPGPGPNTDTPVPCCSQFGSETLDEDNPLHFMDYATDSDSD